MKIAFLILAHRHAGLLAKLCDCLLAYENSSVFIHVDLKSANVFESVNERYSGQPRIHLLKNRYRVHWGSQAQIKATLALMNAAAKTDFDYACLLSGQDLPVKPVREFASFLEKKQGKEFMSYFPLPAEHWDRGGMERLQFFHINGLRESRKLNKLEAFIGLLHRLTGYRRPLPDLALYGGANWFNLSASAVRYVCNYVNEHPKFLKYFRFTLTADEIFVQTILMNSSFAKSVVDDDLRMIDWSTGPEFPRTWRSGDEQRLVSAENKFFARKFDPAVDAVIIDKITKHATIT